MARKTRQDGPGVTHHVTLRGVAGCDVFRDDADRRRLLSIAASRVRVGRARCLADALMDNHIHFVLETGADPLADVVHDIAFRYAAYFNWRHGRPGHLFQNRYGAKVIDSDRYLRNAIAYVHLNPLRARMVRTLDDLATYPWTSYAGLLGTRNDRLVDVSGVLAMFADEVGAARAGLVALTANCLALADDDPNWTWETDAAPGDGGPGPGASLDACAGLMARTDELEAIREAAERRAQCVRRLCRAGWTVDRVIALVCERVGVAAAEVLSPRRSGATCDARAVVAHLATTVLGCTHAEVARRLGISRPAAHRASLRGETLARARGIALPGAGDQGGAPGDGSGEEPRTARPAAS